MTALTSHVKKTKSYPKLRFKEFTTNLEFVKLKNIASYRRGRAVLKNVIDNVNGKYDCIHYKDLSSSLKPISNNMFSKTNENNGVYTTGNELLINYGGYADYFSWVSIKKSDIRVGREICIIKIPDNINSDYLSIILNSRKYIKKILGLTEGIIARQLPVEYILNIDILMSKNLSEQNKIVNFFSKILHKIDSENVIKNKWELLLKSLNEKTFEKNKDSQKYYVINKKLGSFFSFFSGLVSNTTNVNEKYNNNLLPYAIVRDKTICDSKDLVPFNGKGNPKSILNKNDILFISDSGSKNIGVNSIYSSNVDAFLSRCCIGMRLKEKFNNVIYPKYINALFNWNKYRRKIKSLATGSVIYGINAKKLENIEIKIPDFETQIKISKVYYDTNRLIEIQTELIQKIETLKKYFLDSMF